MKEQSAVTAILSDSEVSTRALGIPNEHSHLFHCIRWYPCLTSSEDRGSSFDVENLSRTRGYCAAMYDVVVDSWSCS